LIVADTNLVAYLMIEGDRTGDARAVWERDPEWRLPSLWRSEFLSVLATSVRAGVFDGGQARSVWSRALSLFSCVEHNPGGEDVLDTSLRFGISAYDAQFVQTAIDLGVRLVTADRKLAASCPGHAVEPATFLEQGIKPQ